ncbi:MAG TPA: UDP-glucuronic acid decarboxylase family protein [Acidobacteriaceae bacterium]|jgi:dTDP-glucose 4,6-dehydratase|nr:UDP-glucuronic acid decarboxylase family protein [Acidobacteriaceae bacterium]
MGRILITGAAGFLGSHLADRLLGEGHHVVGIDNCSTGNLENLRHLRNESRFTFDERDICKPFDFGYVDYVFNLASPASPPEYLRLALETLRVGSVGTETMLEIAHKHNAGFLHASTSECYGDPLEHPQTESYWGNVNPIGLRSVYDEAKRFSEALTMAYHRYRGVNTHLVRIFNTYGPRLHPSDGRVISNFMMQALRGESLTIYGDGQQTRSFCYVSDLIEGIVRLARSDEHFPTNIGNPTEFTILECAEVVLEVTGSSSSIRFEPLPEDDPTRRRPDISKARRVLAWEPKVSLREGLRLSLDYFRESLNQQAVNVEYLSSRYSQGVAAAASRATAAPAAAD